jgi:sulfate adenylyltransferase
MASKRYEFAIVELDEREWCDVRMLRNGGYAPLDGFMTYLEWYNTINYMRPRDGVVWPIPIVLPVGNKAAEEARRTGRVHLYRGNTRVAILEVRDVYEPNIDKECKKVYGTTDINHPYVARLRRLEAMHGGKLFYIGGKIRKVVVDDKSEMFSSFCKTPKQIQDIIRRESYTRVVGFQTRNPLHRCHVELILRALRSVETEGEKTCLLLQPVVGPTQENDVDPAVRMRCYQHVLPHLEPYETILCPLPLSQRMAGPREAIMHALIRKNYGCTHFVVGRDHSGPSAKTKEGEPFYGLYDAQELAKSYQSKLGIRLLFFDGMSYVPDLDKYMTSKEIVEHGHRSITISGTELRRKLSNGEEIPDWFTYPKVAQELATYYRHRMRLPFRSTCIWMTGLSGSGKSTISQSIQGTLHEMYFPEIVLVPIDGDQMRKEITPDLGFTKDDRSKQVLRAGAIAKYVVGGGGTVVCSLISPYRNDRLQVRQSVESIPGCKFIEVYVEASIQECMARDPKGLYARYNREDFDKMTGIDDPYEPPSKPDLVLHTREYSVAQCVAQVVDFVENLAH